MLTRVCLEATRVIIARKLKGLEDFITVSSVHWHLGPKGERQSSWHTFMGALRQTTRMILHTSSLTRQNE